tara:strand:- start:558 stop:815 length:258 start_codon:yes stop_codon:yes gene_type:complete
MKIERRACMGAKNKLLMSKTKLKSFEKVTITASQTVAPAITEEQQTSFSRNRTLKRNNTIILMIQIEADNQRHLIECSVLAKRTL